MRETMDKKTNIRNISVVGQVDHGKSTVIDYLIAKTGIFSIEKAGKTRFTDTRKDEQDRCLTVKSTAASLYFNIDDEDKIPQDADGKGFLVNLLDTPGHVDFSSEVGSALRITDGALVVVDCVEGVCIHTETILREALAERIKPVLMINKVDLAFTQLQLEPEEIYQIFVKEIETANVVIATYEDELLGDVTVNPEEGTVVFGSGLQGWGFTLNHFAKLYASKFDLNPKKLVAKLWGDNFWDPKIKKWVKSCKGEGGSTLQRGFCQFVLDPIYQLFKVIMSGDQEKLLKVIQNVGVKLEGTEKEETGLALLKTVMRKFLPIADALLEIIVLHLPSPQTAQKYRVQNLYEGSMEDECAKGIANCDPNAPLMMYVSKMVPTSDKGRFYALGRVFSGTIQTGKKVRIMGPDYARGKKQDLFVKSIQRVVVMIGKYVEMLPDCPCGNIISLLGIDRFLVKTGTISTSEDAYKIKDMKFSVSPLVRVAVEPKNTSDLPKLVEGLKRLSKSDQGVECTVAETGEHIVAGVGELHLEICLKDLEQFYCNGAALLKSYPVVSYRETVTAESPEICLSMSPNKHNRLFAKAEPLHIDLTSEIESGKIVTNFDKIACAKHLSETYDWDLGSAKGVWGFGPESVGPNILVDRTKGAKYLDEIKDSVIAAFQWTTREGFLCEEKMRGVRLNLLDAIIHTDAIHRGGGQIIPTARRVFRESQLTAKPTLMEPIYVCEIQFPKEDINNIENIIKRRSGEVFLNKKSIACNQTQIITAYLPIIESFGINPELRSKTNGKAFSQMIFDHWTAIPGKISDENSQLIQIIKATRKRKGLREKFLN
ncbi:eukaryotic translation elongation factor 2a [Anaeramoeba flamelloides]|uniref:Eukaryotic translation elongation factor 2a n=1 Tax=Anaeramoeba flamelloides TaxID=1746091 RepID=A0ABQ8XTZ5_9EUKA|nr:eukaryotic translation elongation factor 2a [Anaeramoeba flamelloides]